MPTRQELYDRIRESSRDEVILEEMIRLGFWPRTGEMPGDPADEIRRQGELERELRTLAAENRQLENVEALKQAARKRRMEESRRKQQETKARNLREREERAAAWRAKQQTEIGYLGAGVSAGLNERDSDAGRLSSRNLPLIHDAAELAGALGITVGELRFLAFSRRTSRVTHYKRFAIPKKTGGLRNISAPMPRLKRAQEWILAHVLDKVELHRAAHGFRRGRSIVTNAQPHVGADVVVNADIEGFFPTITYKRVKGVFRNLGYSEAVATILALLCSEPETQELQIDNQTYHVATTARFLPQGAPSSPALTNIICRGLDARLTYNAEQLGFTYTRYADDMTFSGSGDARQNIGRLLRRMRFVVEGEGFALHPDKTRVQRKGSRQEVTGLVVNERVGVSRELLRRFRATLFQIERDGPAGKHWGNSGDVLSSIEGFANFVAMVDREKGSELQQRVKAIITRFGRGQTTWVTRERWAPKASQAEGDSGSSDAPQDQQAATKPTAKKKPWWKFW